MSFEGMDVDQLRGLAAQVNADAQTLSDIVATLTGVAGRLPFYWHGPVATAFEQDWQAKYRPALLAAYNTLTALHAHLVSNTDQQATTSAADGSWASGLGSGAGGSTVAGVFGRVEEGITAVGAIGLPLTVISELGEAGPDLSGASRWAKAWSYATDDHLFRLSPGDIGWMKSTAKFVDDSHIGTGLKVVGLAGSAVNVARAGKDAYETGQDLDAGNYGGAANEFVTGVADGLQAYPSPVTYLAGVDVKLLDQVANLDWKDTPSPFSGSNFEQDYVPVLKSMGTSAYWKQAGDILWKAM
jgi:uncharacterized protein YukE